MGPTDQEANRNIRNIMITKMKPINLIDNGLWISFLSTSFTELDLPVTTKYMQLLSII